MHVLIKTSPHNDRISFARPKEINSFSLSSDVRRLRLMVIVPSRTSHPSKKLGTVLETQNTGAASLDLRSRVHPSECNVHAFFLVFSSVFIKYCWELTAHGWEVRRLADISGHSLTEG